MEEHGEAAHCARAATAEALPEQLATRNDGNLAIGETDATLGLAAKKQREVGSELSHRRLARGRRDQPAARGRLKRGRRGHRDRGVVWERYVSSQLEVATLNPCAATQSCKRLVVDGVEVGAQREVCTDLKERWRDADEQI